MKIFIEKQNTTKNIRFKGDVKSLLEKLGINPETVVVVKDDELVLLDEKVSDDDFVKVLSVISGG